MAGVTRFEDMDCYRLSVEVRRHVIRMVKNGPARKDYRFSNQIRDSARGAPRNISEGFSRFIPGEMHRFASYAKGSLDETKNHVNGGREDEYFSEDDTRRVLRLIARAIGAISGWMRYLESPAARRFYAAHRAKLLTEGDLPEKRRKRKKDPPPISEEQNPEP